MPRSHSAPTRSSASRLGDPWYPERVRNLVIYRDGRVFKPLLQIGEYSQGEQQPSNELSSRVLLLVIDV